MLKRYFSHIAHKRRNARFKGLRRVHTPPVPLTAHTAAHGAKHGAFSPPETSTGSIGSTAWVPCASSLSARRSLMSRFPLLRRTTAEMPILLSAATLCRIRRDTFFGVMPSLPTGSICADSSVGVPINSVRSRISSERRMTIRSPSSSAVFCCPTSAPTHFPRCAPASALGTRCRARCRRASLCRCRACPPPA